MPIVSETNEKLVDRVKKGDIEAFEEIVKRYQGKSLSFLKPIIKNEALAEEITQDVFFKIYKGIDKIDTKRRFTTYFYTVLKNYAISQLRKLKKEIPLSEIENLLASNDDLYEGIKKDELRRRIREAVSGLPEGYRRVVSFYYFFNLSYKEIAKKMRLPLGSVKTNLSRAKKKLRKDLRDEKR